MCWVSIFKLKFDEQDFQIFSRTLIASIHHEKIQEVNVQTDAWWIPEFANWRNRCDSCSSLYGNVLSQIMTEFSDGILTQMIPNEFHSNRNDERSQLIHQSWYSTLQSKVWTSSWRNVFRDMTYRRDTFSTSSCDGSTSQMIRRTVIYFSCRWWKIWRTWTKRSSISFAFRLELRTSYTRTSRIWREKILFIFIAWSDLRSRRYPFLQMTIQFVKWIVVPSFRRIKLTCRLVSVSNFDWMWRDERRTRSGDNLLPNSV